MSNRFILKNRFFDISSEIGLPEEFDFKKLPDCGYLKKSNDDYTLFGPSGKKIFMNIEKKVKPVNSDLFLKYGRDKNFPIIMNFQPLESHQKMKRDFDSFLRSIIPEFQQFLSKSVLEYFENKLKNARDIDLYQDLLEFIIVSQFKFFFNYDLSKEQLKALCFFEDYFAFGLYIDTIEVLDYYYSHELFTSSFRVYNQIKDEIFENFEHSEFTNFINELKKKNYSDDEIFDQFYNVSLGGGSTNIAKLFVYLNSLLSEENLYELVFESIIDKFSKEKISGLLIRELYRFIPFIYNHVVPPYILREALEDVSLDQFTTIFKGQKVKFFHLFDNIDSQFEDPLRFNPFRDYSSIKRSYLKTFGLGSHFCCGLELSNIWLHHLVCSQLDSRIKFNSEFGISYETYNEKLKDIQKTKYITEIQKS